MEGYASRGVAIGDSARNAKAASDVAAAPREARVLEILIDMLRRQNASLASHVNVTEAFIARTLPPQPEPAQSFPPSGPAISDAPHMAVIEVILSDTDVLLRRLDNAVHNLSRLG